MSNVLALGAAAVLGAADFIGGVVARRSSVVALMIGSRLIGVLVFAGFMAVEGGSLLVGLPDLAWGVAAGLAGSTGLALLYAGLARGEMGVIAPVTGVTSATLPVMAALILGERPGASGLGGIAVGLLAIALIGMGSGSHAARAVAVSGRTECRMLPRALVAGACIGAFSLLISNVSSEAGAAPLVAARFSGLALFLVAGLATRRRLLPGGADLPGVMASSILDAAGTLMFVIAIQTGLLSFACLLTSLYPVATVVLAVMILKESLTPLRSGGILLGTLAGILILSD